LDSLKKFDNILLFGNTCSGKDTLSVFLHDNFPNLVFYHKIKSSEFIQNKNHYNVVDKIEFFNKIKKHELLQFHKRYSNYYGIEKSVINKNLLEGKHNIIHFGNVSSFLPYFINSNFHDIKILLYSNPYKTYKRLKSRGNLDLKNRFVAYREDVFDIYNYKKNFFDLIIDTSELTPEEVFSKVANLLDNYQV